MGAYVPSIPSIPNLYLPLFKCPDKPLTSNYGRLEGMDAFPRSTLTRARIEGMRKTHPHHQDPPLPLTPVAALTAVTP